MAVSKSNNEKLSRSKYDEEHPTRSFRLKTMESNERLQAYLEATGSSMSDLIERALNNIPMGLSDVSKVRDTEYALGYYEGYQDGYERAELCLPYPTKLMTRRAREQEAEIFNKTRKMKK